MRTMKKTCNVVMLTTEKANEPRLILSPSKKLCFIETIDLEGGIISGYFRPDEFHPKAKFSENGSESWTPQHLYITSDEEIQEGDWCFRKDTKELFQTKTVSDTFVGKENTGGVSKSLCSKIIATTDKSLNLPGIPESFIKKYVEENGKIGEVLVEFTDSIFTCPNCYSNGYRGTFLQGNFECVNCCKPYNKKDKIFPLEPFLRKDNTIRILPAKMYTKEEVYKLCEAAYHYGFKGGGAEHTCTSGKNLHNCNSFKEWFNKKNNRNEKKI